MPIRKINYTGRETIRRQDIRIEISKDGMFSAELPIKKSCPNVPNDALVVVEPYSQTQRRVIHYGSVGNLTVPPPEERNLRDFDEIANVKFRIKVINSIDEGKILAGVDGYKPMLESAGGKPHKSILPVIRGNISPECWIINYENDSPKLIIDEKFGDWREIASSDIFKAFVYPAVLREILTHIFRTAEPEEEIDWEGDDYFAHWLRFGKKLTGENPPKVEERDYEDADAWINNAVKIFSEKLSVVEIGKKVFDTRG